MLLMPKKFRIYALSESVRAASTRLIISIHASQYLLISRVKSEPSIEPITILNNDLDGSHALYSSLMKLSVVNSLMAIH